MNKRIAVLVSGDYREFEIAHKSWEFINNPNVDFYFSVWKHTTQCNKKLNIHIKETVNKNTIRKFIPNCKGIDIGSPLVAAPHRLNSNKMLNRWLKAIKLMIASGVEYDACIIIRPEKTRKLTHQMLENLGFRNFQLLLNLNNAARILINDYNEMNPYPRATAINIKRNADNLSDFFTLEKHEQAKKQQSKPPTQEEVKTKEQTFVEKLKEKKFRKRDTFI